MTLVAFWQRHAHELARLTGEHVVLVILSTAVAAAIGLPVGILAARRPRLGAPLTAIANVLQTVPSLAMLGFLLPLPLVGGVGRRTALVALTLYALLPVVRTTIAGLQGVDPAIRLAGLAMGMTPSQLLWRVELPLALPSIVAGLRVATVIGVGTATVAAAIGAGGLGEYIFRGLSMVDPVVILAGAVPAAALALVADGLLAWVQRRIQTPRRPARRGAAAVLVAIAALGAAGVLARGGTAGVQPIVIGSKNFTEQVVLGELLAQSIERYAGLPVERRLNLGGTFICDRALRAGELDAYVEYTGTALTAIFKLPIEGDAAAVSARVRQAYVDAGVAVQAPLGFDNTFAILVRAADAHRLGLRRISDVVPHAPGWHAGFGYEFLERADGYRGLARTYGLRFAADPRVMDLTLIYRALAAGQVDLVAGDATAGLIAALDLAMLEDDRHYFPPYEAVPLVRSATLLRHPALGAAFDRLAGRVRLADMRAMNLAVDGHRREPAQVVREFLDRLERARTGTHGPSGQPEYQ